MNRSFGIELEIANITRDMLLEMTIETHAQVLEPLCGTATSSALVARRPTSKTLSVRDF